MPASARAIRARPAAWLGVLAVVATACADGAGIISGVATGEDAAAVSPPPREPVVQGPGCGAEATTDIADMDAARLVARCAPGAPAAQPLDIAVPVRVALAAERDERLAPVLLAHELGEFAAEGLRVDLVELDVVEAVAALDAGEVDAVVGRIDAPFFHAVAAGSRARLVLGGGLTRAPHDLEQPQAGLWVRRDVIEHHPDWLSLRAGQLALPGGELSAASLPTAQALGQHALLLDDVEVLDRAGTPAAQALLDREVAAAWLDGTSWLPVEADGRFQLVATYPATESLDGTILAGRLLADEVAVGRAYARAVIRTINTYLTGDYRSDDELVRRLADLVDVRPADIAATPPWVFDWEIRAGTTSRVESAFMDSGAVSYGDPLPEDRLVDRSLVRSVVTR